MGWPSISTVPSLASQSLATRAASVVFPQPVGPTTASVDPAGIFRLMSERTACGPLPFDLPAPGDPLAGGREGGEAKGRARNSISPTGVESFGRVALRSSILGLAVKMKSRRPIEAAPRWKILVTQPSAIMGQTSTAR